MHANKKAIRLLYFKYFTSTIAFSIVSGAHSLFWGLETLKNVHWKMMLVIASLLYAFSDGQENPY